MYKGLEKRQKAPKQGGESQGMILKRDPSSQHLSKLSKSPSSTVTHTLLLGILIHMKVNMKYLTVKPIDKRASGELLIPNALAEKNTSL